MFRSWASMHGGVYVPVTNTTIPNPYLNFVPDRDISTKNGKNLTLMNPAYMTRQIFEIAEKQYGVKGHITSLNPIRPENKADEWETRALQKIQEGLSEYNSIEKIDGTLYMRSMHAMKVEQSCMKCHAKQGYKVGDIRGGISVSIPMDKYNQVAKKQTGNLLLTHLAVYTIVLLLGALAYKKFLQELKKRHSIKKELWESEKKFEILYHNSPDMFVSVAPHNAKILVCNDTLLKETGYTRDEVIGSEVFMMYHESSLDKAKIAFGQFVRTGFVKNKELTLKRKNGTKIPVNLNVNSIRNEKNEILYSISSWKDMTEQKTAKDKLLAAKEKAEESEKKYKRLTDNARDLIYRMSLPDGQYEYVSPSSFRIFGYTPEEFYSSPILIKNVIHPDFNDYFQTEWEKLIAGDLSPTYVYKIISRSGEEKWLDQRNVLIRDNTNTPVAIEGIATDITKQKQAETNLNLRNKKYEALNEELKQTNDELLSKKEEIAKKEELLRLINNASIDQIYGYDLNNRFILANRTLCENLNLSADEIIGKTYREFGFPEELCKLWDEWHRQTYEKGATVQYAETPMPDGTTQYFEVNLFVIKNNEGKVIGISGVNRNITKRKNTEKELIKAKEKAEESDNLKTEFLNNMSHEIRTPMNGIIGFSEFLNQNELSHQKHEYYTRIIQNSAKQLLHIIDDILEISTLGTKQVKIAPSVFFLNDLLMELFSVHNLKAREKKIHLYFKKGLKDKDSTIKTDQPKLVKILDNLIENAIKYTMEGFVEIGYHTTDRNVLLYVKDTGIGINPKNHQMIFERFSQEEKEITKKHGGLGLGLAIANENVELLGGKISLDSEKGKGSTFYVTIPNVLIDSNEVTEESSIESIPNSSKNYTILIAEDEEINYLYLEVLFEQKSAQDFKLIHAKNGKEAYDLCCMNKNIDLVLMDIKMPIMNGHEASEKIKSQLPNLPIIAQTAYSTESDRELALNHGCDDFISKPIDEDNLFTMVYKHLRMDTTN